MGEPLPICFLNGEFLPLREARISPLDRGFLYSDGCYEVTPVYGGRPFRFEQHHDRLTRSLREIRMEDPLAREAWRDLYRELIARNGHAGDLYIYVQVTLGAEHGRMHDLGIALSFLARRDQSHLGMMPAHENPQLTGVLGQQGSTARQRSKIGSHPWPPLRGARLVPQTPADHAPTISVKLG